MKIFNDLGDEIDTLAESVSKERENGKKGSGLKVFFSSVVAVLTMSLGIGYFSANTVNKNNNDKSNKPGYSTDIADTFGKLGNELADKIQEALDSPTETKEVEEKTETEEVLDEVPSLEEETDDLSHSEDESVKKDLLIPDIGYYNGNSVVDAILLAGYDAFFASFEYRSELAEHFEIENYDKSAEKNTELLDALKKYAKSLRKGTGEKETTENKEVTENKETDWVALDDDYEVRKNKDGVEEKRLHSYVLTNIRYVVGDNCHTAIEEYTCPNCQRVKVLSREEDHVLSAYVNNGNGTETTNCLVCGHTNTRNINNDNNNNKNDNHDNDDNKGHDEEKKHSHSWKLVSEKVISLEDGTHDVYRTYECNFDGKRKVLKKNYKCSYDDLKYNKETDKDEQICLECGYVLELEHEHDWKLVRNYVLSNNNGTHDIVSEYKCRKEKDTTKVERNKVNCSFNEDTSVRYVNNHNGTHDVVEESVCDDCHYIKEEILVDDEVCVYTWTLDEAHGIYKGTCECKATKYEKQVWKIESQKFVSNKDGTHDFITVYVDNHGKKKTTKGSENCNFGDYKYNKDTNKDDRSCDDCNYVDSRNHVHTKGEFRFDKDGEFYSCLDDETHRVDAKQHSMKDESEVIYVPNGDGTHKVSMVLGCNTCDYKEQVKPDYDENCDYSWTLDEENGIYNGNCKCGDTKHEKQEWTIIDTKVQSNKEDKTHTITITYQDNRGKKKTEENTYSCDWQLTNTTATSKDDLKHTIVDEYECKTDGCTNTRTETNDFSHDFEGVDYVYDPADGHDKRSCATVGCGFIDSIIHEHKWGEYKDFTATGATQYCSDYEHCGGTKSHVHDLGDPYYDDTGKHQKCKDENCNYILDLDHDHTYEPGTLKNTFDADAYCTVRPYVCECGDSYTMNVDPHDWECFNEIGVKVCNNCDIEADIVKEEKPSQEQVESSQTQESATVESSESTSTETTEAIGTDESKVSEETAEVNNEEKTENVSEEATEIEEEQEEMTTEETQKVVEEESKVQENSTKEEKDVKVEDEQDKNTQQDSNEEKMKLEQIQLALEGIRKRKQILNDYMTYMYLCKAGNNNAKKLSLKA